MLEFHLYENVEQAKSYLKKNDIPETDWVYKLIRELFKGKEGYIGWVTRIMYEDIVPNSDKQEIKTTLENLATKLSTEKYILDILPKPVVEFETYEEFIDEFEKQVIHYKAKKMLDEFPSLQKGFINLKKDSDVNLLSKLFDDEANKVFLRKISAYKNKKMLLDSIQRFVDKKSDSGMDTLLRRLHSEGLPIIHVDEEKNLVIARILDYDQCRSVASRTSWCIARDSSTFRSYVPNGLSRQYIIYLTDLPHSNNNNVIGATFNISGYHTGHAQNDSYVSYEKLKEILSGRGFDITDLNVKKSEVTQQDIDSTPVADLERGLRYTKEEILKIKKRYVFNDLSMFTREVIDENGLYNKMRIDYDQTGVKQLKNIGKLTTEEIIERKKEFVLADLQEFTKEEITKYDLMKKIDATVINNTTVKALLSSKYTKDEIVEMKERYKVIDMELFTKEEIKKYGLIPKCIDLNSTSVREFKRWTKFNNEETLAVKKVLTPSDLQEFTKDEIEDHNLLDKVEVDGRILNKFTKEEIISKKMLPRVVHNTLTIGDLINLGFKRDEILKIPDLDDKLTIDDKTFYDKYLKKSKSEIKSAYSFRYGSRWGDNQERYDVEKTLTILKWFEVGPKDVPMFQSDAHKNRYDRLSEAFDEVSTHQFPKIKKYLDEMGYKYTEEQLIKFLDEISRGHASDLDKNIALIDMGIDRYDKVVEDVMSRHKPIDSWELDKIKEALKPKDYVKFQEIDKRNHFVEDTLGSGGYFWAKQQRPMDVKEYWEKWGNYGSGINLNGFASEYGKETFGFRYGREVVLSYILLSALDNKFDYLYNLKFDWESGKGRRSWSEGTFLGELVATITGTRKVNSRPSIEVETKLTEAMREKLYKWIIEYIWPKVSDKAYFKYDLQLAYYIFDKPKFYQYMDEVKKMKDNYTYTMNNEKEKTITFRMHELNPMVKFFQNEFGNYSDTWYYKKFDLPGVMRLFEEFLEYFLSGIKMTKTEKVWTVKFLHSEHRGNMNFEGQAKAYNKIVEDTFNIEFRRGRDHIEVVDKSTVKESMVITDYLTFLSVY